MKNELREFDLRDLILTTAIKSSSGKSLPNARLILLFLLRKCDWNEWTLQTTQRFISDSMDINLSTVKRSLKALDDIGLIDRHTIRKVTAGEVKNTPTEIKINVDKILSFRGHDDPLVYNRVKKHLGHDDTKEGGMMTPSRGHDDTKEGGMMNYITINKQYNNILNNVDDSENVKEINYEYYRKYYLDRYQVNIEKPNHHRAIEGKKLKYILDRKPDFNPLRSYTYHNQRIELLNRALWLNIAAKDTKKFIDDEKRNEGIKNHGTT